MRALELVFDEEMSLDDPHLVGELAAQGGVEGLDHPLDANIVQRPLRAPLERRLEVFGVRRVGPGPLYSKRQL